MSDERPTGPAAFLSERAGEHIRPSTGTLKRKLGQGVPGKSAWLVTYPSPPMSASPSPPRPASSVLPSSATSEPSAAPTSAAPLLPSALRVAPVPTSSDYRPSATSILIGGSQAHADPANPADDALTSERTFTTLQGGQNAFSIGSADASGSAGSVATRSGRKAKAHVASACTNCKRAHLSCDTQRPCTRCVTTGKEDTCFDVPHKKRGRPRLREENELKAEQLRAEGMGHGFVPMTPVRAGPVMARPIARSRHHRTESLRSLRSQTSDGSSASSLPTPGFPPSLQTSWTYPAPRPPTFPLSAAMVPTAFLDLDFNFIRANRPFKQIVAGDREIAGRQLQNVVVPADGLDLMSHRGRLRGERESRDPAHMPPMLQPGEDPVQGVIEDDVEQLAAGFSDQTYTWRRSAPGQEETFPARVRLAKAAAYFVVVTLPSFRPVETIPRQQTMPSLTSPGFAVPTPRGPAMPARLPDPRQQQILPAPQSPYWPQPAARAGIQPLPPANRHPSHRRNHSGFQYLPQGQPYLASQSQRYQPMTPRLPTTEPQLQATPLMPLPNVPRQQMLAPAIQLPPLATAPTGNLPASTIGSFDPGGTQQAISDDDEDSPRKRRRMDISDVLQR